MLSIGLASGSDCISFSSNFILSSLVLGMESYAGASAVMTHSKIEKASCKRKSLSSKWTVTILPLRSTPAEDPFVKDALALERAFLRSS